MTTTDAWGAPSEIGTVIVGGGIVGMCLAWFLAEEGHDVAVVDDGRHAGTIANAGGLHVQLQSRFMRLYPEMVPAFEETLPFYPRAVRHWQALAARLGEDIELAVTGGLMVAESPEQYAFLEKKCRREQQLGLEVEMLDRTALDRIAPYFADSIVGAELCATEGKVNPLLANQAIRRKALAAGVVHCTETRVSRLARVPGSFAIETSRGAIRAGRVVIAAGSGSGALAADLGLNVPARAEPLHMNITEATEPLIHHMVQHADRQITMKQLSAGMVVIGGGWPATLTGADQHPTVELDSLIGSLSLAQHVIPRIGALRLIRTWAGVNTSVDGRPVVGPVTGMPGLFFAIPGDAGYTLGPLTARLVADTMLGRPTEAAIGAYTADRFN
jgi:glycine/D-amino acid oxidase-like deaminating enzyme